jgi:peptidoglycan/LPS O-acetylase OafA/YrhL
MVSTLVSSEKSQLSSTTLYRADIDGLRAVSILLVVGYHAQPAIIPGGFIGVDIFFVISGFLITRIVLSQIETGTFSFSTFYARRVRRIFPALIVVLAATYLIGWFVLLPEGFSLLGENIVAGVAFVSNLFQLTQVGYFAPDGRENPLLHLWSLGIEEQFYICWPPVLLFLSGSKQRPYWVASMALVSFSVSLMIFFGYKEWSFYSPISRGWELLAGGIVANCLAGASQPKEQDLQLHNLLATIGIAAIVGAATVLNEKSLFPGLNCLLPVLGAVLLILSPNSNVNRTLLSNRTMVFVGLISYPLYLWHWPLLCYLATLRNGVPNVLEIWAVVIVAFSISWLTFRFIELPVRRSNNNVLKLSSGMIVIGIAGAVTAVATGFGFRFSPAIRDIAQLSRSGKSEFRGKCFLDEPGSQFVSSCIESGEKPLLFVWGDSTAAALYPGLKKALETIPFRLGRFAACAPILATGFSARCDEVNDIAFGFINSSAPAIILLHAMWNGNNNLDRLRETISQLKAINIQRIIILGPVPVWKRSLPHSLVNVYRFHHTVADRIATGVSGTEDDERMEAFSKTAGVEYISAWHILCNAEGCMTRVGPTANDVVTFDTLHLSAAGSRFLIEGISDRLFPEHRAPPAGRPL